MLINCSKFIGDIQVKEQGTAAFFCFKKENINFGYCISLKKIVSILLITLLAANISGTWISYHYCGKILQYFSFNGHKKKSSCCCGGTQKKKGCCKTQHCKIKIDDNQSMAKQLQFEEQFSLAALVVPNIQIFQNQVRAFDVSYIVPLAHAPPLIQTVRLHVLHQQFLI
ncbi:MAG: hypothetical protein BGO69_08875 [Bacteroidetes bacterium 46-16]|nr:MAG: hypothetical protein BGO69_08875 [Bacteroidetes bacterium 46-16]